MPAWLSIVLIVLGSILGLILFALFFFFVVVRIIRKLWHFPAPAWVGRFLDSDLRRKNYPPEVLMTRSGIKPGMRVLELGCGSGAYTTHVARAIGPRGKLYALDIQRKMLDQLKAKLDKPENHDITNIELVESSAYELPFADESLDAVYAITVLPEIPDPHRALLEVYRVLKPGGTVAMTEMFADPDYPLKRTTIRWAADAGFKLNSIQGSFWIYTARFVKV